MEHDIFDVFRFLEEAKPWLMGLLTLMAMGELYLIGRKGNGGCKLALHRDKVHGVLFGKRWGFYFYSPEEKEHHVIIFGSSGAGKTSALLIPTLRSLKGGCLVLDIAGDIHPNVHKPDKLVYDPSSKNTIPYNVFGSIDKLKSIDAKNEALRNLAHQIVPVEKSGKSDPYFAECARNLFAAVLITFYHLGADFVDVCKIIAHSDYAGLENKLLEIGNPAALPLYIQLGGGKSYTNAYIMQELTNRINIFLEKNVSKSIRRPKPGELCFTPESLEDHSVYVVLPQAKLDIYAPLVRLITDQCVTYLFDRPVENTRNILLCLDEFTEFGYLPVERCMRLVRKKHVRMVLLTQSCADLDRVYGENERRSILNNVRYKCVLGMADIDEQRYFSALIGDRTVLKPDGQGGYREEKKPWIEPKELDRLGDRLILVHPDGHTKLRKAYYWARR